MKIIIVLSLLACASLAYGAQPTEHTINGQSVSGWATRYKGVELIQPQVSGQEGNSCAYHALFNARTVFDYARGQVGLDFRFLQDEARNKLLGQEGIWRKFVLAKDRLHESGDFVEASVLEMMVQEFFPAIGQDYVLFDNDQNFLGGRNAILNSLDPAKREKNKINFWRDLKAKIVKVTPFSYLFLINTANVFDGEHQERAHWIMLFFRKDQRGVHHYYVADSLNQIRLDSPLVTRIITALEDAPASAVQSGGANASAVSFKAAQQQEQQELERVLRESQKEVQELARLEKAQQQEIAQQARIIQQQREAEEAFELAQVLAESMKLSKSTLSGTSSTKTVSVVVPSAPRSQSTVPGETENQRRRRLAAEAAERRFKK